MDKQIQQEIFSRLDTMASKLGVAAEHLWEVLVLHAYTEGIVNLALTVFMVIVSSITLWIGLKRGTKDGFYNSSKDYPKVGGVISVVGGAICAITTCVLLIFASEWFGMIVNPEYHAWLEISRLIK